MLFSLRRMPDARAHHISLLKMRQNFFKKLPPTLLQLKKKEKLCKIRARIRRENKKSPNYFKFHGKLPLTPNLLEKKKKMLQLRAQIIRENKKKFKCQGSKKTTHQKCISVLDQKKLFRLLKQLSNVLCKICRNSK